MLYICPTPIGNLQDVTLRVLEVLAHVELIACEDTRRTRILLERHGITGRLLSFHEHNEERRIESLLVLLREGKEVALVSDAGMPGLSDPGFTLVRACAAAGIPVTVLPGASAISTALVLSGLPTDRFAFVGFLARGRRKLIEQLATFDETGATLVAFESPRRLRASLAAIGERWPDRELAMCRELTKLHEEVLRGTASEVLDRLGDPVRGEIVLVLAAKRAVDAASPKAGISASPDEALSCTALSVSSGATTELEQRVRAALGELVRLGVGTKKAAGVVAALTGLPGRRAYELGLEVKAAAESEAGSETKPGIEADSKRGERRP
ncbi:MAG: 16S rRNA (cytidine(1402)-2'-O)-methyltransferase [Actinobacteria bacterium]|nr:16S rRNA (cytidine(1402)-2'-O)-methyltransferase [Actinomycetota bacterium]